jgi:hypothetical protein
VGVANGLSYLAGLRIIQDIAPPDHRAEVTSAFLGASYSGFSLPALAVGFAANFIGLFPALVVAAIARGIIALTTDRNLKVKAPTPGATWSNQQYLRTTQPRQPVIFKSQRILFGHGICG